MEKEILEAGFDSIKEFHHLVAGVNLSTPRKLRAFQEWKDNDGTKEGLIKLPTSHIRKFVKAYAKEIQG